MMSLCKWIYVYTYKKCERKLAVNEKNSASKYSLSCHLEKLAPNKGTV